LSNAAFFSAMELAYPYSRQNHVLLSRIGKRGTLPFNYQGEAIND